MEANKLLKKQFQKLSSANVFRELRCTLFCFQRSCTEAISGNPTWRPLVLLDSVKDHSDTTM